MQYVCHKKCKPNNVRFVRRLFEEIVIGFYFIQIYCNKSKKHNSDQYYGKKLCWKMGKTDSRAMIHNKQEHNNNPNKLVHPCLNKADFLALSQ